MLHMCTLHCWIKQLKTSSLCRLCFNLGMMHNDHNMNIFYIPTDIYFHLPQDICFTIETAVVHSNHLNHLDPKLKFEQILCNTLILHLTPFSPLVICSWSFWTSNLLVPTTPCPPHQSFASQSSSCSALCEHRQASAYPLSSQSVWSSSTVSENTNKQVPQTQETIRLSITWDRIKSWKKIFTISW